MIFGESVLLVHDTIPFRAKPVFRWAIKNKTQASNYAAAGFHVSVDRGTAGGCRGQVWGPGVANPITGLKAVTCRDPLGLDNVRRLWETAAGDYVDAYNSAQASSSTVDALKEQLRVADTISADTAYAAEGGPSQAQLDAMKQNSEEERMQSGAPEEEPAPDDAEVEATKTPWGIIGALGLVAVGAFFFFK